jgi:hypothetical protein
LKKVEINVHPATGNNILLGDYIVAKTVPHGKLWRLKTVDEEHTLKTVGRKTEESQSANPLSYESFIVAWLV